MLFRLFLLFTIVPALELALLIKIGAILGALNTVFLVIATAILGSWLVRLEGLGVIIRFQQNMREGIFPAEEILDGAMVLVAGALLVTPGVLTDLIGFSILFRPSRMAIKRALRSYIEKRIRTDIYVHKF